MGLLTKLIIRILGKKLDKALEGWKISKTKVIAVIGVLIYAVEKLGPVFGHPVVIPQEIYALLGSLGLWTLKDGLDGPNNSANTEATKQ